MFRKFVVLAALSLGLFLSSNAYAAEETSVIKNGSTVKISYTMTVDGEVIATAAKNGPYEYVQGSEHMLVGVQKRLEGLKKGDSKALVIPPAEGFGLVRPDQIQEVPKANLPKGEVKAGDLVVITGPDGREERVPVVEVRPDSLVLDFNHPLAGKELMVDVTIVDVT